MANTIPSNTPMTEDDILQFLHNNPDFLVRHPEVLDYLALPAHAEGKNVVDFHQLMVNKLRSDKQRAEDRQRSMIDNARSNMTIQARVHAAVVRLLEAQSLDEMIEMITNELSLMLEVDVIALCMESRLSLDVANGNSLRILPPGSVDEILGDKDSLLQANTKGYEELFGPAARLVKSQAYLRLVIDENVPDGLLVFGSRDPLLFTEGQGTELIGFLGDVIERLLRHFMHHDNHGH